MKLSLQLGFFLKNFDAELKNRILVADEVVQPAVGEKFLINATICHISILNCVSPFITC